MVDAQKAYREIKRRLSAAGMEDAGFEAALLFAAVAGRPHLMADTLPADGWAKLQNLAARRLKNEPLQYILGEWDFMGLTLQVGPGVLIPRPETEEVCMAAARFFEQQDAPVVLDLCAGSGALALGLQQLLPNAQISALECSGEAYAYLCRNIEAFRRGRKNAPRPVQADVFTYHTQLAAGSADLITCNPPYVTEQEYAALAPEVQQEPRMALVAASGGLQFYRAVTRDYYAVLRPGGRLVFEIGAGQGSAVAELMHAQGYRQVEIRRDLSGKDRIALGEK